MSDLNVLKAFPCAIMSSVQIAQMCSCNDKLRKLIYNYFVFVYFFSQFSRVNPKHSVVSASELFENFLLFLFLHYSDFNTFGF